MNKNTRINNPTDETITEDTTSARQGVTGHNVRYVLLASLGGAIIVLAVAYLVYFH
jgi:hypothetical protein